MINSEKYLMEFSGGSLAGKYLVFAGQAEKEGYPQIAQLFRTAARMETNQAHAPGGNLRRIRTTPGYRGRTGSGEKNGLQIISPEMMVPAENEGHKKLPGIFPGSTGDSKGTDASPYHKALKRLAESGKGDYYVCSECGYTNEGNRPGKCPHCRSEAITLVKVG